MHEGEVREIDDVELVADLLRAGYIEEVKPKRGRNVKKSWDANPQE